MFDVFYRSLSAKERELFHEDTGISVETVNNAYLPKDPLKRRIPRPETMAKMIAFSNGRIQLLTLVDYFITPIVCELAVHYAEKSRSMRGNRARLSVLDIE